MKKILLYLLYLLFALPVLAQQPVPLNEKRYLDSLTAVLDGHAADTARANANFLLVDYWKVKDTTRSKTYLTTARKLIRGNAFYNALGYFYEGQFYFSWNKEKAASAFKKAEEGFAAFTTKSAYSKRAAAWFNYALMHRDSKGYDFITRITLQKAIPYAEKAGDTALVAHFYTQLSTVLMNNAQFAKAAQYNRRAIDLLTAYKPASAGLLLAYLSGVSIHCYNNQPDSARVWLQKAKALLAPYPESLNNTLYYYNETLYYTTTGDYNKALQSADRGSALAKKYHQQQLYQQFFFRKYDVYSRQQAYGPARQVLLAIVKEGSLIANSQDRAAIYGALAATNESLHDYKAAYYWLKQTRAITDSLNSSQTQVKINELETRYRSVQNQHQIAALKAQNKQAALTYKNQQLYNWLLGAGCVLLLVILALVFQNIRNLHKINLQKEINYRQQLADMEQKQQLKVTKAMLDGEEHERERMARDLHDGLGGMLAGVKIGLSGWTNNQASAREDKNLHRIIDQLDHSVTELRRIARNMVPETLLKFGLEVALKDLSEFYMRDGLHIDFQHFNISKDMALSIQLNIYRMVQELFSNAIKHAQATSIMLQCSQNGETFFITFEDNGIGFDTGLLAGKKGMGLDNLKNRITYLKGSFEIQSVINEGTTINIEINTHAV